MSVILLLRDCNLSLQRTTKFNPSARNLPATQPPVQAAGVTQQSAGAQVSSAASQDLLQVETHCVHRELVKIQSWLLYKIWMCMVHGLSMLHSNVSLGCLSSLSLSLLSSPLSLQSLTQAEPMQQKQIIGEHLYRQIYTMHPDLSGKITGTVTACITNLNCRKHILYTCVNKCCVINERKVSSCKSELLL